MTLLSDGAHAIVQEERARHMSELMHEVDVLEGKLQEASKQRESRLRKVRHRAFMPRDTCKLTTFDRGCCRLLAPKLWQARAAYCVQRTSWPVSCDDSDPAKHNPCVFVRVSCGADPWWHIAQAGPPGRARLAGELREMDQEILKLTRSLAVSAFSRPQMRCSPCGLLLTAPPPACEAVYACTLLGGRKAAIAHRCSHVGDLPPASGEASSPHVAQVASLQLEMEAVYGSLEDEALEIAPDVQGNR